jgi:RsiW-degrading membrane proteinase PrsW (M82 family)
MKNLIQSFFWGIIAALTALFIELVFVSFTDPGNLEKGTNTFLIIIIASVFIEEIIKYIVAYKQIFLLETGRKAIINGWFAGIGFSLVEIIISKQKIANENLLFDQFDLYRTGLFHILVFGFFAYRSQINKFSKIDIHAISLMIMLHLLYNLSLEYINIHNIFSLANFAIVVLIFYNLYSFIVVNKRLAYRQ